MAVEPLTDAERQRIRELHAEGKSRNDIARDLGRSGSTISKAAAELGLSFDRTEQLTAAVEVRKADAKARRAELALNLLADAEKLRRQMWETALVFSFGGKENDYNEHTIDEPTFADKRNIVQSVSTAITASLKIDAHDRADEALNSVDAWLAAMTGGEGDNSDQAADG